MKDPQAFEQDLASIRSMMERSVKFISISGMSGVLAGTYALIGAGLAHYRFLSPASFFASQTYPPADTGMLLEWFEFATAVLVASIATMLLLSARKARRLGVNVWDSAGKRMLINLLIPLITGGVFLLICTYNGNYAVISSGCLIFYGLALLNASPNLYEEVRYLGYCEVILGLFAAALPGYGLLIWAIGFGVLHIVYGLALYRKYDS